MAKNAYVGAHSFTYTPVEYLESTHVQWINTLTNPTQDTRVEIKFMLTNNTQGNYANVFGSYSDGNATNGAFGLQAFNVVRAVIGKGGFASSGQTKQLNTLYEASISYTGGLTLNGTTYSNAATTWLDLSYPFYIFTPNIGNETVNNNLSASAKVYYFKIYRSDVLFKEFIPVKDSNNVACMYETIGRNFYYNKGSGSFSAGAATGQPVSIIAAMKIKKMYVGINGVARKIKKGYVGIPRTLTPVEYIASSGTQYIDTGFKHNQNTRMLADIDFLSTSVKWSGPFGSWGNVSSSKRMMGAEWNGSAIIAYYGNGSSKNFGNVSGRKTWDFNKNVYKIGATSNTFTSATFQSIYNDLIFAVSSYTGGVGNRVNMKLYSFKIYDNGTLVRDFMPVIDQNNTGYLYDSVEKKLYANQGTGTFTAGSTTGQPFSISFAQFFESN